MSLVNEPTKTFIVPTERADEFEAIILMTAVEQGLPLDKIEVIANDYLPPQTFYVFPRVWSSELAMIEGNITWETDPLGFDYRRSWYLLFWPDRHFGPSSIASVAIDGGSIFPSSPYPPAPTSDSVWRRLMVRLRHRLR